MTPYPLSNVIREPRDARDFIASVPVSLNLPDNVDLRRWAGDIEDQLTTGSCTANATVSALEILLERAGKPKHLSRLFVYWNERAAYQSLRSKDGGAYLSDGFKSVHKYGVPPESIWPFDVSLVNVEPSAAAYQSALSMMVEKFERVAQWGDNIDAGYQIKRIYATLAMGYPVTISMGVSPAIFSMAGPLTSATCQYSPLMTTQLCGSAGGHAMNVVGYMTLGDTKWLLVENSWGTTWGDNGYFLLHPLALGADGWDAWTCTAFAGIAFAPDWSAQPAPLLHATIPASVPTLYLSSKDDVFFDAPAITVEHTGGEGPYSYHWTCSDPATVFISNGAATAKPSIGRGTKTITVTCTVTDSSIPEQQVATANVSIRAVGSVDVESTKGKAYRLYRAAFNRTPDAGGLEFWTDLLNRGADLRSVADGFITSPEFVSTYGAAVAPADFVRLLYRNVLSREPDAGGLEFWVSRIVAGEPRSAILVGFSESPENKQGAQW